MTTAIINAMLLSLGATVILELIFALIWGVRGKKNIAINVLVNTLTNPIVTCTYYGLRYGAGWAGGMLAAAVIVLEISAVLAEGYIYRSCTDIKKPLLFSLCANCFSYFAGLLFDLIF